MTLHVYFRQRQDVLKYCTMPMSGKSRFLCIWRWKRLKRYAHIISSRKSLRGAYLWYSALEKAKMLCPHNFQLEVAQGGVSLVFGVGKG